jgi:hypothetical protein
MRHLPVLDRVSTASRPAACIVLGEPIAPGDRQTNRRQVEMTTTHRIATGIVVTLALATAAPASATPWNPNSRDPVVPIRPAPEPAMVAPAPTHVGSGPVVVRVAPDRGFDWGDAGIGVAGGTALGLLGVGGALVISERRAQRTRPGAAQPN